MTDRKLKIMVCCANGIGSGLLMKMTLQKVLERAGTEPEVLRHCDLREGISEAGQYDVIFCSGSFVSSFQKAEAEGVLVIGLDNVMSVPEAEQKMRKHKIIE